MLSSIHAKNLVILTVVGLLAVQLSYASTWKKLKPATSPPARRYAAMAYDQVSKKTVLFGGLGTSIELNDTWTFDGTSWTQIKTSVSPSPRYFVTMAFDTQSRKLVMFGGLNYHAQKILRDTWVWDGSTSTWARVPMKISPPPAYGAMLFTDPKTGGAMMFGGYDVQHSVPAYNDTWRFTSTGWMKLYLATKAYGRGWGVVALDPKRNNVAMTGGVTNLIDNSDTWTWDGHSWTLVFPVSKRMGTIGAGYAFDPTLQGVVAFGGFRNQETNQTWEWTGTDWALLNPTKAPSAREGMGMAYDPVTKQTLIFGGGFADGTVLQETWVLSGK